MPDEHPIGIRIEGEQPPITVGAAINLSSPNDHANLLHARGNFKLKHCLARVTQSRAGASMMLNKSGAGNMAEAADVEPVMLIAGDDAGRKRGDGARR